MGSLLWIDMIVDNKLRSSAIAFRIENLALIPLVRIGVPGGDPLMDKLLT